MARSVFNREAYRLSTYSELGAQENARMLCHDLYAFCAKSHRRCAAQSHSSPVSMVLHRKMK